MAARGSVGTEATGWDAEGGQGPRRALWWSQPSTSASQRGPHPRGGPSGGSVGPCSLCPPPSRPLLALPSPHRALLHGGSEAGRAVLNPSRFWLSLEKENRIEIGDPPPTRSPHPEPRSCGALSPRPTCPGCGSPPAPRAFVPAPRPRHPGPCPSPRAGRTFLFQSPLTSQRLALLCVYRPFLVFFKMSLSITCPFFSRWIFFFYLQVLVTRAGR